MRLVRALVWVAGAVLAGLAVAALTALGVWLWPGPLSRSTLSMALLLETMFALVAVFWGYIWGRRPTYAELVTGQPGPTPDEFERRDAALLWVAFVGATLFVVWLAVA